MRPSLRKIFILALLFAGALFFPASKKEEKSLLTKEPPPTVEAQSALAADFLTGEVFLSKNQNVPRALASLTKIITMLVVFDRASADEVVLISKEAILTPEPSSLLVGEKFLIRDLVAMAMAESSNDAAYALFAYAAAKNNLKGEEAKNWFLNSMKQKAESLGARTMTFNNVTGLDESAEIAGGYGSAEDLLNIAKNSLDSQIWDLSGVSEVASLGGIKHILKPTNILYADLPNLIGAKTGYTDLAGGNLLVIVEYPIGHPLGIVVLGSSEQGRFEDVKKILEWIKSIH